MKREPLSIGLALAVVAAASFGLSGAFIKPLLESGWSPAAAVTVRAIVAGIVLAPIAAVALRGRWRALWEARWRVLGMAVIGVTGTQLFYFAAVQRIPVGTAILIEFMAPLLLVAVAWVVTRRRPRAVVLVGSVVAFAGLLLIVSPSGSAALDPIGLAFAAAAMVSCAGYFVIAARPSAGLPPVALAAAGLLIAPILLALVGAVGLVSFTVSFDDITLLGSIVPWWVPMLVVAVVATALSYAASITATEILGSRLASFAGLLEVAAAGLWAWFLLGENLTVLQLVGGGLILAGIVFVRLEKAETVIAEAASVPEPSDTPVDGRLRLSGQTTDFAADNAARRPRLWSRRSRRPGYYRARRAVE